MKKFQIRKNLSNLYLKETIICLNNNYINYSPSIGCLLSLNNHFISNLNEITFYNTLYNEFFYKRYDKNNLRYYGPLYKSKTKSKPAYWLTPSLLGHIVGISLCEV